MTKKHVYLGRFAPFHGGHARQLKKVIEIAGISNTLVLIGSSNAISKRTPYTYEDRAKIIKISFPKIEILPLPDGKPNLEYFDGSTNSLWLDNLERLAKERDEEFVFCGGSREDLEVLAEKFETCFLVDRFIAGEGLSATMVREAIVSKKTDELAKYVDRKAMSLILEKYIEL